MAKAGSTAFYACAIAIAVTLSNGSYAILHLIGVTSETVDMPIIICQ